ncbi:hypothetical protein QUC31_002605 [Theobroma cacao]
MRKKAFKPKMKSLKVRVQRIKSEIGKIRDDQRCIREEQRNIGERFGDVKRQCDQLREETQVTTKQTACYRIRLILMLNILGAREERDFDQAASLTHFLKLVSDRSSKHNLCN